MKHRVLHTCFLVIKLRARTARLPPVCLSEETASHVHHYLRRDRKEGSTAGQLRGGQAGKTARDCSAAPSRPSLLTCCSQSPGDLPLCRMGTSVRESHILNDASPDPPGLSTAPTTSPQCQLNRNYAMTGASGACLHCWNPHSVWAVCSQMYL